MASKRLSQLELTPVLSAFDFREGAFFAAERTRKSLLAVIGVGAIAVAMTAGVGLMSSLAQHSSDATARTTAINQRSSSATLAKVDTAGGYSAAMLADHVQKRTDAMTAAVGHELDVVTLLAKIQASVPPEVTLTQVVFHDGSAAAGAAGSSTVEIHGTSKLFTSIGPWSSSLQQIKGLSAVTPLWAGGEPVVQVTLTATVNAAALTTRATATAAAAAAATAPAGGPAARSVATAPGAAATATPTATATKAGN